MKPISLKKIIVPSIPVAVILLLAISLLWTMVFFNEGGFSAPDTKIDEFLNPDYFFTNLIIIATTVINILLISNIVNRFSLIRTKTFLPVLIFLLTITTWDNTHTEYYPHLLLTVFLLSLMIFFQMYRNQNASEQAFTGSLLLSTGALTHPFFIFMIPVVWIGFSILQSLSLKTWLGSIFGTILPYLIYFFFIWYSGNKIDFQTLTDVNLQLNFLFTMSDWPENTYNILISVVLAIGIWGLITNMNKDSIQSRSYLRFLLLFLSSLLIIVLLFADMQNLLLPIIAMLASILIAHPFTVQKSPFYIYTFFAYVAINILYIILKPFWG